MTFVDELRAVLPRHAEVLAVLVAAVADDDRWRWLELGCSVAAGRGDERSDLDLGLGAAGPDDPEAAAALVRSLGPVIDLLVHELPGRPGHVRIAAELASGIQLDLVVLPADGRPGLPPGSVALVDKDGTLADGWTPDAIGTPPAAQLREWAFLGWWALSDAVKYLDRGSPFEAADRVAEARRLALQLHAAAQEVDYPAFGLTSILDADEPAIPMWLEETYSAAERDELRHAAHSAARLLRDATTALELRFGLDVDVPLRTTVQSRLGPA